METKTDRLNRLFKEWEENVGSNKGSFTMDGIVNEPLYENAKLKILFITKEPNDPSQKGWDFREWWNEEIKHSFAKRIAEWSYGLLNDFPPYDLIGRNQDLALDAIKQIAFMNIKKTGGRGNSNLKEITDYLRLNYKYIHDEIEIINPEIIVTGLTWKNLRTELFPSQTWIDSGYDIAITRGNNAKIIDFYHPSSRNAPAASYSLLQNIVRSKKFIRL